MKTLFFSALLLLCISATAQVKIGNNPTTIASSSILELENPTKALVITRVADTSAIANPTKGMIIYDTSLGCFRGYQAGAWTGCGFLDLSTNGSSRVSTLDCSISSEGTMTTGTPVTGVSQTISVTVTKIGTYSISATANGVTFAASVNFTETGVQNVLLVATGTPGFTTNPVYTLNTTQGCSFNRTVVIPSAQVSNWKQFRVSTSESMRAGVPINPNTIIVSIHATVNSVGTYNFNSTTNGVTLSGTGTFTQTGVRDITVTASGTPNAGSGDYTFTGPPGFSVNLAVF